MLHAATPDAESVEDPMRTCGNTASAVSASENWLTKVKFPASEKPVGKFIKEGGTVI